MARRVMAALSADGTTDADYSEDHGSTASPRSSPAAAP